MSLQRSALSLASYPLLEKFLNDCPTQWHATSLIDEELERAGFQKIRAAHGSFKEGAGYWMEVGAGARLVFRAKSKASHLALMGCHTESPMLRLKEKGMIREEGVWMAHVEAYGSPILASWMYKDLGLCGRVIIQDSHGLREHLINIKEPLGILLSPAIHLDREINQKGLNLDKQKHLKVLLGNQDANQHPLAKRLNQEIGSSTLLAHELYLYPLEEAKSLTLDQEWIASWRIDNLASCAACLEALLSHQNERNSPLSMTLFADHEEIGSQTYGGAASGRYKEAMDEILSWLGYNKIEQSLLKKEALLYSVDGAHGLHPVYKELYEPHHAPKLGEGVVVKINTNGRYSTDARSAARIKWLATQARINLQHFHMRADLPCGSTIGPILSTNLGIEGVDIGLPQLAMHASREVMHLKDYQDLVTLLSQAHLHALVSIQTSKS